MLTYLSLRECMVKLKTTIMKKLLVFSIGVLLSFTSYSQAYPVQDMGAENAERYAVSTSSANTITLSVRQSDFNRISVYAPRPVSETVYITVVVWHAPPGIYNDENGQDVATLSITMKPGEQSAHGYLYVGGMPGYIIGGVYSAGAYSPGSSNSYSVSY